MNKLINIVKESIENAEKGFSKLTSPILELCGMSSPKVRHFLNNIVCSTSRYLEIGCWKGSTFVSAMHQNQPEIAFVIDDWREFNNPDYQCHFWPKYPYEHPKSAFYNNIKQFLEPSNTIVVIEDDCFKVDIDLNKICNINTYFYDGSHFLETQYEALNYYYDALDNEFIFIADDWNFDNVKEGTQTAIKDLDLELLFEYIGHADYNRDIENWWNGLYISVLRKNKKK